MAVISTIPKNAPRPRLGLDEDIFPELSERAIVCAVCDQTDVVPRGQKAQLCGPCLADLEITAAHVTSVREAATDRLRAAFDAWDAAFAAADDEACARWEKVDNARIAVAAGQMSEATFDAAWQRARAEGGSFAVLLLAWERRDEEIAAVEQQATWYERAKTEIDAARTRFRDLARQEG